MERRIFHVDVNSAYLSWEAARRVARGEADLRLVPSAIGGDRDKRTGVISGQVHPRQGVSYHHRGTGGRRLAEVSPAGAGQAGFPFV